MYFKIKGTLNNLCIDAKFQGKFEKILKSTKDEKNKVIKLFKSDIMNHVMDVKSKHNSRETSEIALIFIPSERFT